jgi:hypothetical protein
VPRGRDGLDRAEGAVGGWQWCGDQGLVLAGVEVAPGAFTPVLDGAFRGLAFRAAQAGAGEQAHGHGDGFPGLRESPPPQSAMGSLSPCKTR